MAKITFEDKVDLTTKEVPEINKITASDMNEIKTVVNGLDDDINTFVNIKSFGAKGDGVSDDTLSIQQAIDYCKSNSKSILFFPEGNYAISNKIIAAGFIHYKGTIGGASKIVKHPNFNINNPDGDVMFVSEDWDTATSYNGASNGKISNISFDEGGHVNTFGDAIALGHASGWVVSECYFYNMRFHGVDVTGCNNILVEKCKYFGTTGSSYNAFQVDQASTNSIKGINADDTGCDNVSFINNYVEKASVDSLGPQSAAFHIHRSDNTNITISNNYITSCDFLVQTDLGSSGNIGINISDNYCLRGVIDGSSAIAIKFRGAVQDCIIKGNRTFGYNLDVSIDHPTDSSLNQDIIISNNCFNFAVNRSIFVNQAYRVNVNNNIIQGQGGDLVDSAIGFYGTNYFNCNNNNIYDPNGNGIEVSSDAGGGVSTNGLIHDNIILNGDTGLLCISSTNNVLFYSNKLTGTFTTSEININENQSNVRDLDFQTKERTVSLPEAGRTITSGTTDVITVAINGAINGDILTIGYSSSTQGLIVYGNMQSFQSGRIYVYNPTGGDITLPSGNWKIIANSSRFI